MRSNEKFVEKNCVIIMYGRFDFGMYRMLRPKNKRRANSQLKNQQMEQENHPEMELLPKNRSAMKVEINFLKSLRFL